MPWRLRIRPFGRLVYVMPPYVISTQQLETLLKHMREMIQQIEAVA